MATTIQQSRSMNSDRRAVGTVAGGAGVMTFGGLAVAVLGILALIGLIPVILVAIAGIVFGVAMLLEGMTIAGEYQKLARWVTESSAERIEIGGGAGVELLVGLAAIAMGILSLIGIAPAILIPVLIITGGAGLILSAGSMQRLNDLHIEAGPWDEMVRLVAHESMAGGAIAQTLGGIAALVLGILSLVMLAPTQAEGFGTLPQVAMIVLGIATAVSGGALFGKSMRVFHHV